MAGIDRRVVVNVGLGDALVVGLALDEGGNWATRGRAVNVAGEVHAIPHPHHGVGLDHDPRGVARVRHIRSPRCGESLAHILVPVETGGD